MTLAIIKTGGKQYIVEPGKEIKIEKIKEKKKGDKVSFDKVLLYKKGKEVKVGTPFIENAEVEGEVTGQGRGKKITILKYKSKTRHKTKKGHRQPYTRVKIKKIT
jgi:large subunit ribosomal protein L21